MVRMNSFATTTGSVAFPGLRLNHLGRSSVYWAPAGELAEEQHGQVSQALRALGIHQILALSPQARGRSERAFGTIQGRLPNS
jgi:hypothetical protein